MKPQTPTHEEEIKKLKARIAELEAEDNTKDINSKGCGKVFIERAEPLTIEGIKAICMSDEDYEKHCKARKENGK